MRKIAVIIMLALTSAFAAGAQEHEEIPAGTAAHGAIEESHEAAYPEHEQEHGHEERTYFGIPGWILKLLNMILFLGFLAFLLRGPISRAFRERKESIRTRLSEADVRRERAERMEEEIQERLARVEGEIEAIRTRAEEEGRRQGQQIVESSEREAEKILASARSEIEQRVSQARRELRQYAAELATERATTLVETSIDERDKSALFDDSVRRLTEVKS